MPSGFKIFYSLSKKNAAYQLNLDTYWASWRREDFTKLSEAHITDRQSHSTDHLGIRWKSVRVTEHIQSSDSQLIGAHIQIGGYMLHTLKMAALYPVKDSGYTIASVK